MPFSMVLLLLFPEDGQQGHPPINTDSYVALASLRTKGTTQSSSRTAQSKGLYPGFTLLAWRISCSSTARGALKGSRRERLAEPPQAGSGGLRSVAVPVVIRLSAKHSREGEKGWGVRTSGRAPHRQTHQKPAP